MFAGFLCDGYQRITPGYQAERMLRNHKVIARLLFDPPNLLWVDNITHICASPAWSTSP
jgi:hypothetical protein